MMTIWGCGNTLYGGKNPDSNGFKTSTEWFTIFFLPIIPLASYRVREGKISSLNLIIYRHSSTSYEMIKIGLDRKQVFYTYLYTYSIIVAFVLLGLILIKVLGDYVLYIFPSLFIIVIVLGVGIWLYSLFAKKGKKVRKSEDKVIYL